MPAHELGTHAWIWNSQARAFQTHARTFEIHMHALQIHVPVNFANPNKVWKSQQGSRIQTRLGNGNIHFTFTHACIKFMRACVSSSCMPSMHVLPVHADACFQFTHAHVFQVHACACLPNSSACVGSKYTCVRGSWIPAHVCFPNSWACVRSTHVRVFPVHTCACSTFMCAHTFQIHVRTYVPNSCAHIRSKITCACSIHAHASSILARVSNPQTRFVASDSQTLLIFQKYLNIFQLQRHDRSLKFLKMGKFWCQQDFNEILIWNLFRIWVVAPDWGPLRAIAAHGGWLPTTFPMQPHLQPQLQCNPPALHKSNVNFFACWRQFEMGEGH